ncbi:12-oxophytodienoate reductase [Cellulomonas hominis]|uniref:oxidoreductase n=1 Tax=Cellulomonas hominis TaxID=156981 RepID=UPI001B948C98|nr:12-oxophytodienoate reductase [Cellulomonas hominis]VTR75999.1 NADH oxidase [Cellulomonas hominis]
MTGTGLAKEAPAVTADPLFQPITIGDVRLPNRIVMAPMGVGRSRGGVPTPAKRDYLRRRAAGGVGLIITGGTFVDDPAASNHPLLPNMYGEDAIAAWGEVVDAVHDAGGRIMVQLMHAGAERVPVESPDPHIGALSPSGTDGLGDHSSVAMTRAEVHAAIDAFARSAATAAHLGFDGVEIHGAHGFLIDQFLWDRSNTRTDEYGVDRTRFATDVIQAVRQEVGRAMPISFRLSQWKTRDYGARVAHDPEQLRSVVEPIAAGVDIMHVSTRRYWQPAFNGSPATLAELVKLYSGLPTITVGSVGLSGQDFESVFAGVGAKSAPLDDIRARLRANQFDLVAVGRALLGDADWVSKVRDGDTDSITEFRANSLFDGFR